MAPLETRSSSRGAGTSKQDVVDGEAVESSSPQENDTQQTSTAAPLSPETAQNQTSGRTTAAEAFSPPPSRSGRIHREQISQASATPTMQGTSNRDFDQLDLNNMDFAESDDHDPLLSSSLFQHESPVRGLQHPEASPRHPSSAQAALPVSAPRRRSPQANPYAYQHPYSASREPFRRSPPEYYPPTPSGHQVYHYSGYPHQSPYGMRQSRSSAGGYGYPGYAPMPPPEHRYLMSPHAGLEPFPDMDEGIPPPPQKTPERQRDRSPFRSPISSSQKLRRSPEGSPTFGPANSWGMDTPNATIDATDFSPMEPRLDELHGTDGIDINWSRSDESPGLIQRSHDLARSPVVQGLSPHPNQHLQGITRSPVVQAGQPTRRPPSGADRPQPVTASVSRLGNFSRHRPSPPSSVRKSLWPSSDRSSGTPRGGLRVEIGGSTPTVASKLFVDINTRLHSRPTPTLNDRYTPQGHSFPPHPGARREYSGDAATPIKSGGFAGQTPLRYASSSSKYPLSATKPQYGPLRSADPDTGGKENNSGIKKSTKAKRTPCNCKKTGCLKLYCICYAAREFCKDCNCTDCLNNEENKARVDEAIRQTQSKNRTAFESKIKTKGSAQVVHSVGCKCRKTECLKKYCECFQAGILCADKCKCVDCHNKAGSQALIDKRKKIKDDRGFRMAMQVSNDLWRGPRGTGIEVPPPRKPSSASSVGDSRARKPTPSMGPGIHPPITGMSGSKHYGQHPYPHHGGPPPPPRGHPHHPPPHYHPHMYLQGMPPGYPSMGMQIAPAGYGRHHRAPPHPRRHLRDSNTPRGPPLNPHVPPHHNPLGGGGSGVPFSSGPQGRNLLKRPLPSPHSPRTPGVRKEFDPASSKKKRKIKPGQEETSVPFFGIRNAAQPKTTALAVFSFLSNEELYNAGLVCKSWSKLAMDEELWKYEEQ